MIGVLVEEDKLGKRAVVILKGFPCSWGRCIFCPFIIEQSCRTSEIITTNSAVIKQAIEVVDKQQIDRVAVFNGSSFHELPFVSIDELASVSKGRIFEIEERPEFVNRRSVVSLLKLLRPRKLVIRIGFENYYESIRNDYLRKGIPQSEILRIAELRRMLSEEGLPIELWTYVLFGMEGISEESVKYSVIKFKEILDGVIAVKYHRYLPIHPEESSVSKDLAEFLERECNLVDWGGEEWVFGGEEREDREEKDSV